MTWQDLLNAQRVRVHKTSPQEIHDLRAVVQRDLTDAKLDGLSDDRRFRNSLQCSSAEYDKAATTQRPFHVNL
jgi:hypothetical protein